MCLPFDRNTDEEIIITNINGLLVSVFSSRPRQRAENLDSEVD